MVVQKTVRALTAILMAGSALSLTSGVMAADVLTLNNGQRQAAALVPGQRVQTTGAATQARLDNGAIVSFVGAGAFTAQADGSVTVHAGNATVLATRDTVRVSLPGGTTAQVTANGGAGTFTVNGNTFTGNVLAGQIAFANGNAFSAGQAWRAAAGQAPSSVIANAAQAVPAVADQQSGGITAAATNGQPVGLGQALAAIGASGDVVAAAVNLQATAENPTLANFPAGDAAVLAEYALSLAQAYGAPLFQGVGSDLVRTYLSYLEEGGAPAQFQTAYGDLVAQYVAFLRDGGLPADFTGANTAALNAYLSYIQATGAFGGLSAADQALIESYLDTLAGGGGDLGGGIGGFMSAYVEALKAYFSFLESGGVPSAYAGLSATLVQQYLEALSSSGLLNTLFGEQAEALTVYLDYLKSGGNPDQYDGLPITPVNPTPVDPGPVTPQPGTVGEKTNQNLAYAGSVIGIDTRDQVTVTTDSAGIAKYVWTVNAVESPERGTSKSFESGSAGDVIGWTRWADGTTAGTFFSSAPVTRAEDSGMAMIYGEPATNIPTSGTVTYALIGATKPTIRDGSVAPGTFDGSVAVAFSPTVKIGVDMQIAIGGHTYNVVSTGGVADPSTSQLALYSNSPDMFGTNFLNRIQTNPGGPACAGTTCEADVRGFLAGPGASHLGLVYSIYGGNFDKQVDGVAAFAK